LSNLLKSKAKTKHCVIETTRDSQLHACRPSSKPAISPLLRGSVISSSKLKAIRAIAESCVRWCLSSLDQGGRNLALKNEKAQLWRQDEIPLHAGWPGSPAGPLKIKRVVH